MQRLRRIGLALGAAGLAATAVAPAVAQSGDVWVNPEFLGGGAGAAGPGGTAGPLIVSPGPQRYRLPFNRPADERVTLRPPGSPRAPAPAAQVAVPVITAPPVVAAPKLTSPTPPVTPAPVAAAPVTVRPSAPPKPAAPEAAPRIPVIGPSTRTPSTRTPAPPAAAPAQPTAAPKIDLPVVAAKPSAPATVEAPSAAPTPPAAPPPATVAAPRQVAPSTDWAAATTTAPASDMRIAFAGKAEEPDAAAAERIRAIAAELSRTDDRLKISAYAAADDETTDWARRVSLRRAMNVRQLLLDGGVQSFRIQVRALGTPSDGGPGNRVDLDLEKR